MLNRILTLAAIVIILIMGYGYWHVSTYGWLNLSLLDVSAQDRKYRLIKDAKIMFLSSESHILAEGKSDSRHGVVYLSHPEVGFCVEEEASNFKRPAPHLPAGPN